MFTRYKSNAKKNSLIKSFLSFMPMLSLVSSISSLIFLFLYSKNTSLLDFFMKAEFPVQLLTFIFIYFILVFACLWFMFHGIRIEPYKFKSKTRTRLFLCCSLVGTIVILILLIVSFYFLKVDCRVFVFFFLILIFPLIIILYSLNDDESKDFICFARFRFIYSILFFPVFFIAVWFLQDDSAIFKFVFFCLLFLVLNDFIVIYTSKNKRDIFYRNSSVVFALVSLFILVNEFQFQKTMLKMFGVVQDSSQSGWYLVKDRDILDFFTARGYLVKYNKNIDDRENYYIKGYLFFNIGNLRVICPHDFEVIDNQKLDSSRCLNLTSEDIKFMKKDFPKNNENIAVMVAKTVMKIGRITDTDSKKRISVKELEIAKINGYKSLWESSPTLKYL